MTIEQDLRIEIDRLNIRLLQLNEELNLSCEMRDDLQQRIDKAIEYVEENCVLKNLENLLTDLSISGVKDLLEILKGDDKSE